MRISTSQMWSSALNNYMNTQQQQIDASNQVTSGKISTDLAGYGSDSGVITSYQSTLATTNSYLSVASTVSDRLSSQDLALNTTSQSAGDAKQAILDAVGASSGTSLMQGLQGAFSEALNGLNYQYNGSYLFSGGNDNTPPVNVSSMSQLSGSSVSVSQIFTNGTVKKSSTIDTNTTLQTGMLASDLGTKIMQIFKDIQDYNDDPTTGPFGDSLTDAQKTFLTQKAQEFSDAYTSLTDQTAVNGNMQSQVKNTTASLQNQADSLSTVIGNKTDVNMAQAVTDLQQAQIAVQASAQVINSLKSISLLNYLQG